MKVTEKLQKAGTKIAGKIAYEALKDLDRKALGEALGKLPDSVRSAYYQAQEDAWYAPECRKEGFKEHLSPSGKYRLVVSKYASEKGCWDVTLGQVYEVDSEKPIFEVRRNYHSFPLSWVEAHPNGHDYLVCGSKYMGQTILELDTSTRKDSDRNGFCWAGHSFNVEHQMLVVEGCYWGGPYESRFFDFSDPMSGWPEIELETCVDFDDREPEFNEDGTITCFQSEYTDYEEDEDDQDDEKEPKKQAALATSKAFRREGLRLVLVNEWVSEKEQRKREARVEWQRKYDEWLKAFRASDPLYLAMVEGLKDPLFSTGSYDSVGSANGERLWNRRIVNRKDGQPYTIDLRWGCETGPVQLTIFKDGSHVENKFFMEHSVASMESAFAYAKTLLSC
jgi:hypothetical protein